MSAPTHAKARQHLPHAGVTNPNQATHAALGDLLAQAQVEASPTPYTCRT